MSFPSEGTLQRAIAFFAALGVGVAVYIVIADSGGGAPVCLAGGGGCQTVADSSYSHLFGVNVAVYGVFAYLLLLGSAFLASDGVRLASFLIALGGLGFSVYLTYIELFKIEAVCEWCIASAILMTILFLLAATRLVGYGGIEETKAVTYGG